MKLKSRLITNNNPIVTDSYLRFTNVVLELGCKNDYWTMLICNDYMLIQDFIMESEVKTEDLLLVTKDQEKRPRKKTKKKGQEKRPRENLSKDDLKISV